MPRDKLTTCDSLFNVTHLHFKKSINNYVLQRRQWHWRWLRGISTLQNMAIAQNVLRTVCSTA